MYTSTHQCINVLSFHTQHSTLYLLSLVFQIPYAAFRSHFTRGAYIYMSVYSQFTRLRFPQNIYTYISNVSRFYYKTAFMYENVFARTLFSHYIYNHCLVLHPYSQGVFIFVHQVCLCLYCSTCLYHSKLE